MASASSIQQPLLPPTEACDEQQKQDLQHERLRPQQCVVQVEEARAPFSWGRLWTFAGPGLLMCIAYVDPGNLESDLQTGATTGYTLLWLLLVTTIMGFLVQMQAAKLGVVTGKHLAEMCRSEYPRPAALLLWIMAEVAIIGSDVQEVIGSAIALSLLSGGYLPLWVGALLSAAASFILLLVERFGIRQLEAVFAVLIAVMMVSFGVMFVRAGVPAAEVAEGFLVPHLPKADIPTAVALFGSLIMPHNIYLHSALVQSRNSDGWAACVSSKAKREALSYFRIESGASLVASLFINLFVVSVFAAGFYRPGEELPDIGLKNAGEFLGRTYGTLSVYVWGLGLLAAGQSSTMTGTYTGQFVMSGFLDLKVSPWARIVVTRAVALVPTMALAPAMGTPSAQIVALAMDPASTQLDRLNQGLNLLQSVQLPFALIPVLTFTGSTRIMGRMANGTLQAACCWGVSLLVIIINMTAVAEVTQSWVATATASRTNVYAALTLGIGLYFSFICYLLVKGAAIRMVDPKVPLRPCPAVRAANGAGAPAAPAGARGALTEPDVFEPPPVVPPLPELVWDDQGSAGSQQRLLQQQHSGQGGGRASRPGGVGAWIVRALGFGAGGEEEIEGVARGVPRNALGQQQQQQQQFNHHHMQRQGGQLQEPLLLEAQQGGGRGGAEEVAGHSRGSGVSRAGEESRRQENGG